MNSNPFLRNNEHGGSFLPQDYVQHKAELRANIICLALFGIVMFGIVGAFFVTNRQWLQVKRERQAITVEYTQQAARIEQLKNLEAQKAEMMAKAEVTTALVEKVPRSILMAELVTRMPDEMGLLELHLISKRIREAPTTARQQAAAPRPGTGTGQIRTLSGRSPTARPTSTPTSERVAPPRFEHTLRLVGVARANNNVADYLAALKACSLLDNVELRHIKNFTLDKVEMRHFEIEAVLRRDADARGIEPVTEIRQAMEAVQQSPQRNEQPVTTAAPKGDE
jgi:Tfp pilus assembly protein PilN